MFSSILSDTQALQKGAWTTTSLFIAHRKGIQKHQGCESYHSPRHSKTTPGICDVWSSWIVAMPPLPLAPFKPRALDLRKLRSSRLWMLLKVHAHPRTFDTVTGRKKEPLFCAQRVGINHLCLVNNLQSFPGHCCIFCIPELQMSRKRYHFIWLLI